MKTKIAFLVSLLFLVSGAVLTDGIEVRTELDNRAKEEASSIDDLDISVRPNHPGGFRSRKIRSKLSVKLLRGFRARLGHFLSAGRIKKPSGFSQQELYRLQEVFRL
jgi:hypothetical protein